MLKTYIDLFIAFFRASNFTFGGGPAAISLVQKEVVDNFQWMDINEFTDAVALGNSLPGPIATKLASVVGYKVGGVLGAAVGLTASVLPTTIAIILLFKIYDQFKSAPWMNGMMVAVRPVVVLVLFETVYKMAPKSFISPVTFAIGLVSTALIFYFKVHPALIIVAALAFGGLFIR